MIVDSSPQYQDLLLTQKLGLFITETITIAFFVFDYVARLASCPRLFSFLVHPLNIVDVLVIIPYFIQVGVEQGVGSSVNGLAVFNVLKLFRVVRVLRLLRFGRLSGLQTAVLLGFKKALDAIFVFFVWFLLGLIFTGTLIFFSEQTISTFKVANLTWVYSDGTVTPFQSIYDSFFWSLITLSFLGEGTVYPRSALGQAVLALAICIGICVFIIPVALILRSVLMEVMAGNLGFVFVFVFIELVLFVFVFVFIELVLFVFVFFGFVFVFVFIFFSTDQQL